MSAFRLHTGIPRVRSGHNSISFPFPDDPWYREEVRRSYRWMRRGGMEPSMARMVTCNLLIMGRASGRVS